MEQIDYHYSTNIQKRFSDFDRFSHVNNSVYFNYFDCAKNDYFRKVISDIDTKETGVAIVSMKTDFISEICEDEYIEVQTAVAKIGNKSLTLSQRIVDTLTQEVKCECTSILVFFNLKVRKSVEINHEWISKFEKFEGRELKKKE